MSVSTRITRPRPLIPGSLLPIRGRQEILPIPRLLGMATRIKKKSSRISLAVNLRAARTLFEWSQEELGLKCGLKRTYVGALERREVNPGIDNLDKLAIGVGVGASVLLLSPELAYTEIYAAFNVKPKG